MNRAVVSVCLVPLIALLIAGCAKEQQVVEVVRPVRTLTVAAERADLLAEFSGEVRPRYESRLGFRVGGKILRRLVDVGAQVKKGQVLAQSIRRISSSPKRRRDRMSRLRSASTNSRRPIGALPRPAGEELHQPGRTRPPPGRS